MLGRVVTTIAFSFPVSDGGPSANKRPPPEGKRAAMAAEMALVGDPDCVNAKIKICIESHPHGDPSAPQLHVFIEHCISSFSFSQVALTIRLFYHFLVDRAFSKHQVIVGAFLNDATIIDDCDTVRIPHCLQSMSYNDGGHFSLSLIGTGFKEMIQSLLYNPLTFTVQSAEDRSDEKEKNVAGIRNLVWGER